MQAYADSKLHDTMLALAVARRWSDVLSNVVEPGWVATRMGGPNAPDDLEAGPKTQAWLAVSDDPAARVTGKYFYHQKARSPAAVADDADAQERLLEQCATFSGIALPP
jgi:NAD(P)-dependent dehydrogenase (short-subunit alcohol dehydrogenase family)